MHPKASPAYERGPAARYGRAGPAPLPQGPNAAPWLLPAAIAGLSSLGLPFAWPAWRSEVAGLATIAWMVSAWPALDAWRRGLGAGAAGYRLLTFSVPVLAAAVLGYVWAHHRVSQVLEHRVPPCADATVRTFDLEILDAPTIEEGEFGRVARFRARVTGTPDEDCPTFGSHEVRLSWYDPPGLSRGQRWQADGRLRPSWSYANPAGFDYERWLLGEGLEGTGYVSHARRLGGTVADSILDRSRRALKSWVENRAPENAAVLLALMIGDDSQISSSQWQALRDSGTVHLLVVSGLHVGVIGGCLYFLGRGLGRLCPPLLLFGGSRRLAGLLALVGSGAYVLLSGSGVPALRAWLMTAATLVVLASGRTVSPFRVVLVALGCILVLNPLAVHQQGFRLSFGAVLALVLFFQPRCHPAVPGLGGMTRRGWALLQVQAVLFIALSPMLASAGASVPLISPVVNALAVPVVTLAVLPLVLLAAALAFWLPDPAWMFLRVADALLGTVMAGIESGGDVPGAAMGVSTLEWVGIGASMLLLGGVPGWRSGLGLVALWWLLVLPDGPAPREGEFRLTALDVGQGTAVLVDTRRHRLIFDAGPAYPSGFDLGSAAVLPSFRLDRRQHLDALVISHDDVDHAGGARAVIRSLAPEAVWRSFALPPGRERAADRRCRSGERWQWDGVTFRFLHPPVGWHGSDNDGSCVLLIETPDARALLAGDISARVERRLHVLPVTVLLAPHHGSATSSSAGFVSRTRPEIVFVSTDRRSRYGHPHPDVLARYAGIGARVYVTGREGALRFSSSRPEGVRRWRRYRPAYWRGVSCPLTPPLAGVGSNPACE